MVGAGDGGFDIGLFYAGPGGVARQVRGTAGGCVDCEWQVTAACDRNRPTSPGGEANCARAVNSCPAGVLQQVWLRRPGEPWRPVDTVCVPLVGRVSNVRDLAPDVAEAFRHLPLPAPRLAVQPPVRAVVGIPSIFYTRPDPPEQVPLSVAGFAVRLTAAPTEWTWTFGDGAEPFVTDSPGAPYPDQTVVHSYRHPGRVQPAVTTAWSASYRVDGADLVVPVDEEVTRTTAATVTVREARAHLVGGRRP